MRKERASARKESGERGSDIRGGRNLLGIPLLFAIAIGSVPFQLSCMVAGHGRSLNGFCSCVINFFFFKAYSRLNCSFHICKRYLVAFLRACFARPHGQTWYKRQEDDSPNKKRELVGKKGARRSLGGKDAFYYSGSRKKREQKGAPFFPDLCRRNFFLLKRDFLLPFRMPRGEGIEMAEGVEDGTKLPLPPSTVVKEGVGEAFKKSQGTFPFSFSRL